MDRSPLRVDLDDLDRIEVTETGLGGRRPALYFALRGVFEDGTPPPFWAWDVVWTVIFPGILFIPIFLGRMVALVERGELIIRFGFFSGGGKKIPLELIERAEPSPTDQFANLAAGVCASEPTTVPRRQCIRWVDRTEFFSH